MKWSDTIVLLPKFSCTFEIDSDNSYLQAFLHSNNNWLAECTNEIRTKTLIALFIRQHLKYEKQCLKYKYPYSSSYVWNWKYNTRCDALSSTFWVNKFRDSTNKILPLLLYTVHAYMSCLNNRTDLFSVSYTFWLDSVFTYFS